MMKHFSTIDTKFSQARNSTFTSQQTSSLDLAYFQWQQTHYPQICKVSRLFSEFTGMSDVN